MKEKVKMSFCPYKDGSFEFYIWPENEAGIVLKGKLEDCFLSEEQDVALFNLFPPCVTTTYIQQ